MELSPATKKKNIQISSLFDRADPCGRFTPNKNPPACREHGGGQPEDMGAKLVGVGCLIDRTGGEAQKLFDVPVKALASLKVESWEEQDCPLCKQGLPVVKPGSRAKF